MSVWTLNDSREQRDRARLLNAQQYPFKKKPPSLPEAIHDDMRLARPSKAINMHTLDAKSG